MDCLDDNTVAAYLARRLSEGELDAVVEHLSQCDACLAVTCAAGSDGPAAATAVGRYTIIEMIGQGAMGSVYVAHDPQLDRKVALKVVRADRAERGELQTRMTREARAMAQVRHANVVTVYDSGELADGVFIAMELVEGETLAQWLAAKPRAWRDVLAMFAAAGRGLAAAHAAGIVHRDFKPDNVLVDAGGRVAVTDFGVASVGAEALAATVVDTGEVAALGMTRTGMLLGTPRFMSPEQLRGAKADARSDQFSFAVALYEAIYGAPPFAGRTVAELAQAVTGEVPAAPRASPVPASIHRALTRALAPDPGRRFPSIDALLGALGERRRRPWLLITSLVLVATVVAAFALWPRHAAPAPTTRRTTVLVAPFTNTTGNPALDDTLDATTAAIATTSLRLDAVAGMELLSASEGKPPDIEAIAEAKNQSEPTPLALVHGSVRPDGTGYAVALEGTLYGGGGVFAGERHAATLDGLLPATVELARALVDKLTDAPAEPIALSTSVVALHAYEQGQLQTVTAEPAVAIASFERALSLDPELSAARAALGLTLYNASRKAEAVEQLERAFRGADRIPERSRLTLLGDYYGVVGRYSESIFAYQQLLAKWPGDGRAQINLTSTAIDANSWPLALQVAREVVKEHPGFEIVRRNLVLAELGNTKLADVLRDGGALLAELPNPSAEAISALASAYELVGRRAEAAATAGKLAAEVAPIAYADLAAYEGRVREAMALLAPRLAAATGNATEHLMTAALALRVGDVPTARAEALAAQQEDTVPLAYVAASIAIATGETAGYAERAQAWIAAPEADRRMFGQLLLGDLATTAVARKAAYVAASRIGDSWLVHQRLARAAIASGDPVEAERELTWCLDHRGTAALVFAPSLFLLPEIYLELARSIDHRGGDARAAYQAVVDLAPAAHDDPWTNEARSRLAR